MTDISFKHRIIALVSFTFAAIILTVRSILPFTLVLFGCLGVVIFFADRILDSEKIKNRTVFAFFVTVVCYQTFYQLFNRIHDNNKQLLAAAALAIFLAGAFAVTDRKKLPYSIFSALLICFLDVRIAVAYCLLLLNFSIVTLQLERNGKKTRKSSNKKNKGKNNKEKNETDPFLISIISIVTSVACLAFCVYSTFKSEVHISENLKYIFTYFKNTFGFLIFIIYLIFKLMKSDFNAKSGVIAGLVLTISATPVYFLNYGWSSVSLFLISAILFLTLVCLERKDIVESIKEDFRNHRYLCFVVLLMLIR